ncbi:MAG: DUF934 domain-containing protein [Alphaproteobacteria bacterium]
MPLIKDGRLVEDGWVTLDDEAVIPEQGDVIISLERLRQEGASIKARIGRLGVALKNSINEGEIEAYLPHIDLIALHFPAFTDGRAYSQARQLRTKHGFTGELRATGNVLADQAAFLARVGFDNFEVDDTQSIDVWNKAVRSMSLAYQRGYDGEHATRDAMSALPECGNARDCASSEKAVVA